MKILKKNILISLGIIASSSTITTTNTVCGLTLLSSPTSTVPTSSISALTKAKSVKASALFARGGVPSSKPASSKEQDLEWTRNAILKHIGQLEAVNPSVIVSPSNPTTMSTSTTSTVAPMAAVTASSSSMETNNGKTTKVKDTKTNHKLRKRDRLVQMLQKLKPF